MNITTIGIDLAKTSFSVHGVDAHGKVMVHETLSRAKLLEWMAQLPACLVGLEACGGAHEMARRLQAMGHDVRLMAAKFVAPYCTKQKNDASAKPVERCSSTSSRTLSSPDCRSARSTQLSLLGNQKTRAALSPAGLASAGAFQSEAAGDWRTFAPFVGPDQTLFPCRSAGGQSSRQRVG